MARASRTRRLAAGLAIALAIYVAVYGVVRTFSARIEWGKKATVYFAVPEAPDLWKANPTKEFIAEMLGVVFSPCIQIENLMASNKRIVRFRK